MYGIHYADRPLFTQPLDLLFQGFKSGVKARFEIAIVCRWKRTTGGDSFEVRKISGASEKIGCDDDDICLDNLLDSEGVKSRRSYERDNLHLRLG
jgi:hypothetical protein